MLFFGRLISGAKTAPVVRSLFESRTESYFTLLQKVFCQVFVRSFINTTYLATSNLGFLTPLFQHILTWKTIVIRKLHKFEEKAWNDFVYGHPNMQIAKASLENVSPHKFWSISQQHPDLVSRLHI